MCVAPSWTSNPYMWKARKKRGKEGQYKWSLRKDNRQYICYSATYIGDKQLTPQLGFGSQYIGITCQGLKRRKSLHINQSKRGRGSVFQIVLKELGYKNFEWKIEGEGSKKEMQRLESRLIGERNTVFPWGFNAKYQHAEEYAQWDAEMERLESDPGYIAFKNDIDDFLMKAEIAYASNNPKLYENLEEWDIDHKTNTLVRRKL